MPQWMLGGLICIIGSATASLGITLQKRSHNGDQPGAYITHRAWQIGFLIYLTGQAMTMLSMSLAPQSLIAVLGASSLIFNGLLSPWCLQETLHSAYIMACGMIILGASLVAWACPHNNQSYTLMELLDLINQAPIRWFFLFASLCLVACLILRVYLRPSISALDVIPESTASRQHFARLRAAGLREPFAKSPTPRFKYGAIDDSTQARSDDNDSDDDDDGDNDHVHPDSGVRLDHFDFLSPRNSTNPNKAGRYSSSYEADSATHAVDLSVKDQATSAQMTMLALLAATVGALCASCSVLLAKCIAQLLKTAYLQHSFEAFEDRKETWGIIIIFLCTAVGSVHFMNVALREAPAVYVYPFYYSLSTSLTVASGFIYFQEYKQMTVLKLVVFFIGLCIAISGASFATSSNPTDAATSPAIFSSRELQRSNSGNGRSDNDDEYDDADARGYCLCHPFRSAASLVRRCFSYLFPSPTHDIPDLQLAHSSDSHAFGQLFSEEFQPPAPNLNRAESYVNPGLQHLPSLAEVMQTRPHPLALGAAALEAEHDE